MLGWVQTSNSLFSLVADQIQWHLREKSRQLSQLVPTRKDRFELQASIGYLVWVWRGGICAQSTSAKRVLHMGNSSLDFYTGDLSCSFSMGIHFPMSSFYYLFPSGPSWGGAKVRVKIWHPNQPKANLLLTYSHFYLSTGEISLRAQYLKRFSFS